MAESNRKGSFWLFEAGQRSLDATWELYQNNTRYGWYAGGSVPAATSLVDRIDFANDSPTAASPRGSLTAARFHLGAVGNANYGWFGGGQTPAPAAVSAIERIQYSNDSPSAASARGTFPAVNSQMGAASNLYYGWFAGGLLPASVSTVLRIDFANDSPVSASIRGPLTVAGGQISGTGNQYYGYFGGGQAAAPAQVSHIQRIDYANDSPTAATQRGPLSSNRSNAGAVANLNYGWFGGGYVFPAAVRSTVDRMDFANDSPTAAVPRGPLTTAKAGVRPSGNQNYGWFSGGSVPAIISNVDRIDYSNDTVVSSPRGGLTTARGNHGATAGITSYGPPGFLSTSTLLTPVANYGWWAGGYAPGSRSTVDRIDFSNDSPTTASPRGPLTVTTNANAATSNNYYGWVNQGTSSLIDRIELSNDLVTSTPRGSIPSPGSNFQDRAAAGNANYGWHSGGGIPSGRRSTIDRIDYANDTSASTTRGPLPSDRYAHAATSNNNYGWHAGGNPGLAQITRIDYSNDSPAATGNRGSLPSANEEMAGTGNANYGWFSGGNQPIFRSAIYRVDYANDAVSATLRGLLTKNRANFKGSGNSLYGWVGPSNAGDSTIDRIDYSNDTATASARGNLSQGRFAMASFSNYVAQPDTAPSAAPPAFYVAPYVYGSSVVGTSGSANYGWFGGGLTPTPATTSSVDRLDFSNDTATTSPRGPLSAARYGPAATGNASYGWFGGGATAPTAVTSIVDRVDFANDSPTSAIARGPLSSARHFNSATGNANYGWFAGGVAPVAPATFRSTIDRIDFANESPTSANPRGPLSLAKGAISASSNGNYGWFYGGLPGQLSSVDRIDFANESPSSASPRGTLTQGRWNTASVGNTNYGWIGGGAVSPTVSIVERIDYSNDTATASIRNSLSGSRYQLSAAGNASYGWFSGGAGFSFIDRVDFANDTNANARRQSRLSNSVRAPAATSNYIK